MSDANTAAIVGEAPGSLFVVSTPIGNMGDFSFRAVEVLKSVRLVLAEDTRHTRHLFERYGITTPAAAYHEHNEAKTTPALVARLRAGESLALVSDAGTPLLSDPGSRLVAAAIEAGITVVPIPGASALLSALVASGLGVDRFTFFGFLTRTGTRNGARRWTTITTIRQRLYVASYEAPNRVAATLGELEKRGNGDRPAAVAREMTKQFEEVRRGTVGALRAYYEEKPPRGEVVLVIGAAAEQVPDDELVRERVQALRRLGMSTKDAAASVAQELGVPKRLAYRFAQDIDGGKSRE